MATVAKTVHCVLKRPAPRASTASTDRAASAAVATQSGAASSSRVARCGSSAMKAAASASCKADVHEQRRRPVAGDAGVDLAQQGEAPEEHAHHHRGGEPQPAAEAGERVGGAGDDGEIDHQRPGARRLRRHEQRHHQRARQPEARQRRSVQGGGQHGGDADDAEQDEGGGRADELVERVRGIDGAERADGAGGGEDARHMRGGDRLHGRARARCGGTIRRRRPAPARTGRRARCARRGRRCPARSRSAPAAGRPTPAGGRRPTPPSACRAAPPAWCRWARVSVLAQVQRPPAAEGGATAGGGSGVGVTASGRRGRSGWGRHHGDLACGGRGLGGGRTRTLAPQVLQFVLQPAQPRQDAVELELQRRHALARAHGHQQGDEADQNDQEFHSNRPSAACLARPHGACPDHATARSAERKSAAVPSCTELWRAGAAP